MAANRLMASVSRETDDDPGRPLVGLLSAADLEIVRCGCRRVGGWWRSSVGFDGLKWSSDDSESFCSLFCRTSPFRMADNSSKKVVYVKSKIGSMDNYDHKAGGGTTKVTNLQ